MSGLAIRMLPLRGYLGAKVKRVLGDMTLDEWDGTPKRKEFTVNQAVEITEAIRQMRAFFACERCGQASSAGDDLVQRGVPYNGYGLLCKRCQGEAENVASIPADVIDRVVAEAEAMVAEARRATNGRYLDEQQRLIISAADVEVIEQMWDLKCDHKDHFAHATVIERLERPDLGLFIPAGTRVLVTTISRLGHVCFRHTRISSVTHGYEVGAAPEKLKDYKLVMAR